MSSIAQPTDSDFEITFADLAHAQLRDRAPQLLDYLLGFQVIDQNEDQTHGVGVLGFKVGEQMLFVPAFFLNGELKQNLIYIKNQDLFVPLQDNWVSYLLNRRPFIMGQSEPRKEQELGIKGPDFAALSNTQSGGSAATIFGTRQASWQDWTAGVETMFAKFGDRYKNLDTLPEFLAKTASHGTADILVRTMRNDFDFANKMLETYKLADLMPPKVAKAKKKVTKQAGFVAPPVRSPLLQAMKDPNASSADRVRVLFGPKAASELLSPGADMERLMRGEIVIKDAREEANVAYKTDEGTKLENPTETGQYELLLSDGEFRDVYVAIAPRAIGKGYSRVALVIDKETKSYCYWWTQDLWCRPHENTRSEEVDYVKDLPSVSSVSIGSTYSIIDPDGRATVAFTVRRKDSRQNGQLELYVEPKVKDPGKKPNALPETTNDEDTSQFGEGARLPFIGDVEGHTGKSPAGDGEEAEPTGKLTDMNHIVVTNDDRDLRVVGNTLFVPEKAHVMKLSDGSSLESWAMHDPSSLIDVEANLLKSGAQQFTIMKRSSDFYVENLGPFNRVQVVEALVKKAGLRGNAALSIVDAAVEGKRHRYLLKQSIAAAPPIPEPDLGYNDYAGVAEQYPQNEQMSFDNNYDPNPPGYLGKPERHQIFNAAATGQKDIFDTSAISSLVRTSDSNDLITQYLSDIILGLDRVGRILFMYYWLNEQFRDRYGQENMVELEDQLKNVTKSLGDLVLFLKQRQIESSPGFNEAEIELGAS